MDTSLFRPKWQLDTRRRLPPINRHLWVDSVGGRGLASGLGPSLPWAIRVVAVTTVKTRKKAGAARSTKRQLLIDVATKQFAERGYDGARVDRIVEECKVSKNLLYHYFDSKEELFIAVMEQAYAKMRLEQNEWSFLKLEPEEAIAKLVVYTFDHFVREPTIISLLNTENLYKARHIEQSSQILRLYDPLLKTINNLLARGQKLGKFKENIDPIDLYITIAGLGYFYLSNRFTLSYVLQVDLNSKKRLAQRRQHMVDVVLSYIKR
jgi:TetR/AcrR family transcriptional regulator